MRFEKWLDRICWNPSNMAEVITHKPKTYGENDRGGIWERLAADQYGTLCPNYLTRAIRFSCDPKLGDARMISLWFFVMLEQEPSLQNIIIKEDLVPKDVPFFKQYFIPFLREIRVALFSTPFTSKNSKAFIDIYLPRVRILWQYRSSNLIQVEMKCWKVKEQKSQEFLLLTKKEKKIKKRQQQNDRQKRRRREDAEIHTLKHSLMKKF